MGGAGAANRCRAYAGDGSVRLVKGSHIVVPRLFAGKHAFMLQNPDGRIVFAIPYEQNGRWSARPTCRSQATRRTVRISDDEIRYLCDTINRYFQRSASRRSDVRWTYAGVRPLSDDASDERVAGHARLPTRADAVGGRSARYCRSSAARSRPIGGSPKWC